MERYCRVCEREDHEDGLTVDGLCWSCDLNEDPRIQEQLMLEMMTTAMEIVHALRKERGQEIIQS